MHKTKRIYWDACIWIAVINEERSVSIGGGKTENRFAMCEAVMEQAKSGDLEIVVSAFTLAEVCKSPEAKDENTGKLPNFLDHEFMIVVPVDKDVGLKAQSLQVSGLVSLKPPDAIHLASAQKANCEEFHTFDNGLIGLDGNIAARNGNAIKICKPGEGAPLDGLFEEVNQNAK